MPEGHVMRNHKGGKNVRIKLDKFGLYKPEFTTGGQLPDELNQRFTRIELAEKAINDYFDSKSTTRSK